MGDPTRQIRVGLVGTGASGRMLAAVLENVSFTFGLEPAQALLVRVAGEEAPDFATSGAPWSPDWQQLVADDGVDLVCVAAPVGHRADVILASAQAGKHLYFEPPLGDGFQDAARIAEALRASGVVAMASFPSLSNPAQTLARKLIKAGEVGEPTKVRLVFDVDSGGAGNLHDPDADVLATYGAEIIAMARSLVGEIDEVCGPTAPPGGEDSASSRDSIQFITRFASGALGAFACNRRCVGRRVGLAYEIQGTKGALRFTQERMNEIQFYTLEEPSWRRGYKTIYSGPIDRFFGEFHPIPGAPLGFLDEKTIEFRKMIEAVAMGTPFQNDLGFALDAARLVEAVRVSMRRRQWVGAADVG